MLHIYICYMFAYTSYAIWFYYSVESIFLYKLFSWNQASLLKGTHDVHLELMKVLGISLSCMLHDGFHSCLFLHSCMLRGSVNRVSRLNIYRNNHSYNTTRICSAQSRNRYNSGIVLRKVGILTLRKTIPELSLRKVRIGTK